MKKIILCCLMLLSALDGHAQVANNTSLVGTVTDPSAVSSQAPRLLARTSIRRLSIPEPPILRATTQFRTFCRVPMTSRWNTRASRRR